MKKVICIDGLKEGDMFSVVNMGKLYEAINNDCVYEGSVYSVIEEVSERYFRLYEKDYRNLYLKSRFIPLSEIDETEMINQKENVTL